MCVGVPLRRSPRKGLMRCDVCGHKRTSRRCDECARRRAAAWYAANKKRAKKTRANYYAAHKDVIVARATKFNKDNRVRIREANRIRRANDPERYRQYLRDFHKRHPEKSCEKEAKRRATKAAVYVEDVDRWFIYVRDGGRCHICKEKVGFYEMHVDHVIPLCKGGPHSRANCKASHSECNLKKGGRLAA